ncbi:MAG: histidine--tRNA ligase [Candidatus Babeliales bacterium]
MITKIRGTQDFLDLTLFNFIIDTASTYLRCHQFTQIATPILEPIELFKRSLGLETDVVTKQMFTIATQDSSENICLRPEVTASTMRAFLEHNITQLPWKVFSYGPIFRYERPQKGRYRQFHQVNVEIIDTDSIWQDAYFIIMLDRLFAQKFLLENYALLINFLGCPEDRQKFKKILDEFLTNNIEILCETCQQRKEKNILRVFDCKNSTCQELYRKAPQITDVLCKSCAQEWQQLKEVLDMLSVSYTHMPTLVRGLDYYDKTVFEFTSSSLGAQSAFCGGGRYNHLASHLGYKKDYPSLGAAIGIERLLLLLEPIQEKLQIPRPLALQVIMPLEQEQYNLALLIADELQTKGLCIEVFLDGGSLKSMMRKAHKLGAQHIIIIGSEEQEKGEVVIKNMITGKEERVKQTEMFK